MSSKRWNSRLNREVGSARTDAFIEALLAVCKQHGLVLGHEDEHGAFRVADASLLEDPGIFEDWLRAADTDLPDDAEVLG